jgi:hypothetical protein
MGQAVDQKAQMQAAWDAAASGDYGPAFDNLADEVRIENGPGAGPWRHGEGKENLAEMLLELSAHFGDTFQMDGHCLYADERCTIALVTETGKTPDGGVYENLAVWVERRRADGLIDWIWTVDLDIERCLEFWQSYPASPSRDFS